MLTPSIRMGSTFLALALALAAAGCAPSAPADTGKLQLPDPGGPHKIGVVDFELVDASREETFAPGTPRRIPVRAWYPAQSVSGEPRWYTTPLELEHQIRGFSRLMPVAEEVIKAREDLPTHAYEEAVPIGTGPAPTVIFSHGGFAQPQSNTALMEHLASHGYLVLSISHPYLSSATLHPNGDIIPVDQDLIDGMMAAAADPEYLAAYSADDPAARLEAQLRNNSSFVLSPHFLVWEADFMHVIDHLTTGDLPDKALPLKPLVDTDRLGTFGMSFGASATAAAHKDARVKATVNIDGGVFDSALYDVEIRVPALIMHSDPKLAMPGKTMSPHSEFLCERLVSAGTRPDVIRVETRGSTHIAHTDACLTPPSVREVDPVVAASLGTINGQRMALVMNAFVRRFFDHYLSGTGAGLDADFRAGFPEVVDVDLSPIRDWAATNPEPGFMSYTHVFIMNRLLAADQDVKKTTAALDRRYILAYELDEGPKGETVWWTMAFDPSDGMAFSLQAPEKPADLTFKGHYAEVIRAMRQMKDGQQVALPVTTVGNEYVMTTVGPAFAAGQKAATVKATFPEV
jgi:predicted dienelactone hydrolase